MKQKADSGKTVSEPVRDVMDSYGVFNKFAKNVPATIQEETEAAERGMAEDALKSPKVE